MRQAIMLQGTSSDAGKTVLVAGLCRLFANRGLRVAPFKSQNMALNSFVTATGAEIGRATAVQAAGARQEPIVEMNPLLLKPKADDVAQLIVNGKPWGDVSASDYFLSDKLQDIKLDAIRNAIGHLEANFDLIIAEGAGSCAEPNLRRLDVVNMGLAHLLDARVFVIADVNKGGAFADILGTLDVMRLTEPADIDLIEGFLLNKFRGDRKVLQPAIEFTERHSGKPIAGVLPFINNLSLEEEDRIREFRPANVETDIAVIGIDPTRSRGAASFGAGLITHSQHFRRRTDAKRTKNNAPRVRIVVSIKLASERRRGRNIHGCRQRCRDRNPPSAFQKPVACDTHRSFAAAARVHFPGCDK